MLAYPITLDDDDGTLLATSPDFPELTTFGEDRDEAIARAVHALEEAIAARIHDRRDVPMPSGGDTYAVLPTLTSVKVMLYQGMREQARRQGGIGSPAGMAHATGGPGARRPAPVTAGPDARRPRRNRTAAPSNGSSHDGPGSGCRCRPGGCDTEYRADVSGGDYRPRHSGLEPDSCPQEPPSNQSPGLCYIW